MTKNSFVPDEAQKVQFPLDVALGMTYLHAWSPPLIHRDLKRCARGRADPQSNLLGSTECNDLGATMCALRATVPPPSLTLHRCRAA